jgi:two-component system phosphate regulon sensor histidine kinase PhoR
VLVAFLAVDGVAAWIADWAMKHTPFDLTFAGVGPDRSGSILESPLFPTAPSMSVRVRPRRSDPAAERSRQRLFLGAVGASLLLTAAIAYLAIRDTSRELRTASVRAAFVTGVTHELKTPLASIRLLAETLRWGRAKAAARDDLLDTIVTETDRLNRLVDNVLSSAQVENGTRTYHPRVVWLDEAVRAAVARFESMAQQHGFAVSVRSDDAGASVRVDQDAFQQAVLNLLSNAVKYSGASRQIRVQVVSRGDRAEVSVADDGIGLAPDDARRVFDPFYRSPAARDTAGTGLGLALVRHFARAHGGDATVESQLGAGSRFSIWLPRRSDEMATPPDAAAPDRAATGAPHHG